MRIFWSWQSDTPGKTGRHFVRTAIDEAVQALKLGPEVDEPFSREDEAFEALHVDQDRQGVPGSPDLAPLIFEKIADPATAVFIADVTLVGVVSTEKDNEQPKKLINANVAIELGYALGKLGGEKVLMVLNEHYGDRSHLPFDLRGKGGPLLYRLSPAAAKEEIEKETKRLKKQLKDAIGLCIGDQQETKRLARPFPEKPIADDPSRFRSDEEPIGEFWNEFPQGLGPEGPVYAHNGPTLWLRVMPTSDAGQIFSAPTLRKVGLYGTGGTLLTPLEFHGGLHNLVAEDGIGMADIWQAEHGMPHAQAAAWLFETGEIWSFQLLSFGQTIPFAEKKLADHLDQYAKILVALELMGPYRWIAGLTNVKDFELETPPIEGRTPRVGRPPKCMTNTIVKEGTFTGEGSSHEALSPFFEEIFRKCATERRSWVGQ